MIVKKPSWYLIGAVIFIKICGIFFAPQIFSSYTPLVDSQRYISGLYTGENGIRTSLVQWLATSLDHYGGPYFAHFIFSMISVSGLIYYYLTGGRRYCLLLTLLLPSIFVWSSIVGKEAIFCGGMGIALVIWTSYTIRPLRYYEFLILALSLVVCFVFRPHYAVAILWLYTASYSIKKLKKKAAIILAILFSFILILMYLTIWNELLFRGYSGIESTARSSRFEYFGILTNGESHNASFKLFKEYIPLGMIVGIVGPLPIEVMKRIEFLPFFVEGILILLSPLIIYNWAISHKLLDKANLKIYFILCFAPAIFILMLLHAPFGILNPGTAIRWRTNFELVFYLAPLLLVYRLLDEKTNENITLSS